MKRLVIFALAFVFALSLVACVKKDDANTTQDTSAPTQNSSVLPETTPTTGINIPDPTVNNNSTDNGIMDDFTIPTQDSADNSVLDDAARGMR